MSYPINYPTPQGANIQIFKDPSTVCEWVKPQGASFVWFTLIGAGGGGGIGNLTSEAGGGAGGAVTNFMGPAFLMPDMLRVSVGKGGLGGDNATAQTGGSTNIIYQQKNGVGYTLLTANGGAGSVVASPLTGASGGAASPGNAFTAMGFYQSVAGQSYQWDGSGTGPVSTTTFTSAGAPGTRYPVYANYGYQTGSNYKNHGFFQMQPIIVSCGGSGGGPNANDLGGMGGIGSGGGGAGSQTDSDNRQAKGGDGLVIIITW